MPRWKEGEVWRVAEEALGDGPLRPRQVARRTGRSYEAIKKALRRFAIDNKLMRFGNRRYALAEIVQERRVPVCPSQRNYMGA
jgi:hypothetical protein